jgi:hypothetical protein
MLRRRGLRNTSEDHTRGEGAQSFDWLMTVAPPWDDAAMPSPVPTEALEICIPTDRPGPVFASDSVPRAPSWPAGRSMLRRRGLRNTSEDHTRGEGAQSFDWLMTVAPPWDDAAMPSPVPTEALEICIPTDHLCCSGLAAPAIPALLLTS